LNKNSLRRVAKGANDIHLAPSVKLATVSSEVVDRDLPSTQESLLQVILDNFPGGMSVMDSDLRVTYTNRAMRQLLNFPDDLFVNGPPLFEELLRFNARRGEYGPGDVEQLVAERMALAQARKPHIFERQRPDGTAVEVRGLPVEGGGFVTTYIDVTARVADAAIERKLADDHIRFLANHDSLTGLPNRALLKDRLSQALLYAQRYDRRLTLASIDLDNFKIVNDTFGHGAGDELLKVVATRLIDCVRASDTVARLGGDEFVVLLLDQPADTEVISGTLKMISAAIAERVHLEGRCLKVTSSMGAANYPEGGTKADTLLDNADAAMYHAKEMGRDNLQFYTPELSTKIHEKFRFHEELRNAVARSEFVLFYQPQVDLRTGRVFAVEALIRWNHPVLGIVPPTRFIPAAEETGLIVPIGDWVLQEACRQNKAWQDAGLPLMTVCVNVSARQFQEKALVCRVVSALQVSGLDPKYLELELTESLIMQNLGQAVATMKELRDLGVQLAIDDFGTGYSSLSALKTFPVARLKIDKSFISDLVVNESDRAVASAMILLGQKLNLRVIAEGVETDEQLAFLRDNNCDEMQGYHFSKPVPACGIEKLLKGVPHNLFGPSHARRMKSPAKFSPGSRISKMSPRI
jgi:diguanylate cyclase (GGDEF)-like protein